MNHRILVGYIISIILLHTFGFMETSAQVDTLNTIEEAQLYYYNIAPKDEDYKYTAPLDWSENLLNDANIVEASHKEAKDSAAKILDNNYTSCWKTNSYEDGIYCTIDLGKMADFDRLVIFNVFSDARGTGGGNNSVKRFELATANNLSDDFKSLGEYQIKGPRSQCIKIKSGGGMCFFINNTSPEVIELPKTTARYLKIILKEAYWVQDAPEEWKSSYSLSELMLFNSTKW